MRLVLRTQCTQDPRRRVRAELCGEAEIALLPEHRGEMRGHEASCTIRGTPTPWLDVGWAEPGCGLPRRLRLLLVADEQLVLALSPQAGVEVDVNDSSGMAHPTGKRFPKVSGRALCAVSAEEKPLRLLVLSDRNGLAQLREPKTQYFGNGNRRRTLVGWQSRAFAPTLRQNRRQRLHCVRLDS